MLIKELIIVGACCLFGILMSFLNHLSLVWFFLLPIYITGTVYGLKTLAPMMWKLIAGTADKLFASIILKSTIGIVILLVFVPVAAIVLGVIGWVVGIVELMRKLAEAVQEEGISFSPGMAWNSMHRQTDYKTEKDPYTDIDYTDWTDGTDGTDGEDWKDW